MRHHGVFETDPLRVVTRDDDLRVILESDPGSLRPTYRGPMDAWPIRRFDLVLGLVVAVAMVVELVLRSDPGPAALAAAAAVGLAQTGRRAWPVPSFALSAGAIILLGNLQPGWGDESATLFVALVLAEYALGAYASGSMMWVGAVVILCGVVFFTFHDGDPFYPEDIPFALFVIGGPWAAGLAIQLRRNHERSLAEANAELERTRAEEARRAVAAERARIARELHDVVSHAIAVTVLQARGGRRLVGLDDAAVREALDAIEHTNTAALGDMRRLLAVLRDTEDEVSSRQAPQPSLARLDDLVGQVRQSGLPVEVEQTGAGDAVPPGVDLSAYRIVQEALTNVLKHAGPGVTARVRIDHRPDELVLTVTDDGVAGPESGHGSGLIGIRERAAVVGGEADAGPAPGGGFQVTARLPYSVGQPVDA
jgi:signal transduction histidine kinase